jgi:hypothetical protein
MVFKNAYIISWKPSKERLELLRTVVDWTIKKDLTPHIIAMQWEEKDYEKFPEVVWMKLDVQLPPGQARNVGLNHFYSGEDDYCIILDDDTYIEKGDDIIDIIRTMDYKDVGVVTVVEHAHPEQFEESDGHIFRIPEIFASGVFIVRNRRRLFFNPRFRWENGKLQYAEDVDFLAQAWYEELGGWIVTTAITNQTRDREITPSTWYYPPTMETERKANALIKKQITPSRNRYMVLVEGGKIQASLEEVKPFRVDKLW